MEKAIWNGKEIIAFSVADDYETEKVVRRASSRRELLCPDENCEHRVLKYCHGDKKQAYFAHLQNSNCEYEKYDNETEDYVKNIKQILFNHFSELGYDVKIDQKLIAHHYSHIVIYQDQKVFPIQIITKFSEFSRIMDIYESFKANGISANWIVTDANFGDSFYAENELNFAKRFSLNEGNRNSLLTINLSGEQVAQYRVDENNYVFDGKYCLTSDYPRVFKKIGKVNDLVFNNGNVLLKHFDFDYEKFISLKMSKFEARVIEMKAEKEALRLREEREIAAEAERERIRQENIERIAKEKEIKRLEKEKKAEEKQKLKELKEKYADVIKVEKAKQSVLEMEIPVYKPGTRDPVSVWDENSFITNLKRIVSDAPTYYRLILNKVRYCSQDQRNIFLDLYKRRNEFDELISLTLESIYSQLVKDRVL